MIETDVLDRVVKSIVTNELGQDDMREAVGLGPEPAPLYPSNFRSRLRDHWDSAAHGRFWTRKLEQLISIVAD